MRTRDPVDSTGRDFFIAFVLLLIVIQPTLCCPVREKYCYLEQLIGKPISSRLPCLACRWHARRAKANAVSLLRDFADSFAVHSDQRSEMASGLRRHPWPAFFLRAGPPSWMRCLPKPTGLGPGRGNASNIDCIWSCPLSLDVGSTRVGQFICVAASTLGEISGRLCRQLMVPYRRTRRRFRS
jgi:hypothetical protein